MIPLQPQNLSELLNFRLTMLLADTTLPVCRVCEHRGLTTREWRVLASIAQHQPMASSELAEFTLLDRSKTSRAVQSLHDKGLVQRETRPGDRRWVRLSLTDRGQASYQQIFAFAAQTHHALMASLSTQEQQSLDQLLCKLQVMAKKLPEQLNMPTSGHNRKNGRLSGAIRP